MNKNNDWKIIYEDYIPEHEPLREALFTLGNGYIATRAAAEESKAENDHYPGTYLAGGYNRAKSEVSGRIVENEDLVNWPNWLSLTFKHDGGSWFLLDDVEVLHYRHELDLYKGIMKRTIKFREEDGRETSLIARRFVNMKNPHFAGIQWEITPENWSGKIQIRSALDGTVTNSGVPRYRDLTSVHLQPLEIGSFNEESIYLRVQANQSKLRMVQAARTRAFRDGEELPVNRRFFKKVGYVAHLFDLDCDENESVKIEKIVAIYSSKDRAITEPVLEAKNSLYDAGSFDELAEAHAHAWSELWYRCDIDLKDGNNTQLILRLHIFHILQTASQNTIGLDVGIPARGWHGEAYRGHIFWDELFVFPFLNFQLPELARSLLMYRYHRLPAAKRAARLAGFRGAMFPWQSGSNGREESQVVHLNPKSGKWDPDNTYLQRHVGIAIAYNIYQYYEATRDIEFLMAYGAEMMLEIARFWSSLSFFNKDRGRYEIHNVVGPDEFHTEYPDSDQPGLNNNAYTNVMAVWVLRTALDFVELLSDTRKKELFTDLKIDEDEITRWDEISRNMFVPFMDNGIISQFEGYENLEDLDFEKYRGKYGDIQRLDRILKAEGDSPNRYKVSKQADVLMLFFLLSSDEIENLFNRLGYTFDRSIIPDTVNYYIQRSSHGSTLSRLVYSWVFSRSDREESYQVFKESLISDFEDIQGGTTAEGIHLGAMAGTVDMVQRCYTGLEIRGGILWLNPRLPKEMKGFNMRIRYRGHWIWLHFTQHKVEVSFESGHSPQIEIGVIDKVYELGQGDCKKFLL
ncbi:glycoside hydrolase family 65 protein [Marinilabilia rubra]|uniref:Trehalose 6-phosphate phosphorylase n=1 Tax=Marinilabilia rubra TaxID=2162893 RepID=A0A2U2BE39_9BACT|nr:glycosyl hydrolase family 65 protein [Marinilabilia rubra]PWE01332.1 trehalose 6-phosphate phosphorylase [Marinilabilia rubra]